MKFKDMEAMYESRFLSENELVYNMTNSKRLAASMEIHNDDMIDLERVFAALTPGRKKVAVAAVELYKRMQIKRTKRLSVQSSQDIYNIMSPFVSDLPYEEFWVLGFNNSMKILKKTRLSFGGIDQTCVDVRLVMRELLMIGAVVFAVVHNHPSGNAKPSDQDRRVTEVLRKAGQVMSIKLADHVIIGGEGFYSFADEGMI